ncbi:Uncharacterised protein [Staphylococcus aureus]|nr:Uncharacterised protein [Staphylococcus aureus]
MIFLKPSPSQSSSTALLYALAANSSVLKTPKRFCFPSTVILAVHLLQSLRQLTPLYLEEPLLLGFSHLDLLPFVVKLDLVKSLFLIF